MNWMQEFTTNKELQDMLSAFFNHHSIKDFKRALKLYDDSQQEYICKTKTSISKVKMCDIYYLTIKEHRITVHSRHGQYQKYGTLNKELKVLSSYGFIKCAQSYIVSLSKIRTINPHDIVLINNDTIPLSRNFAPAVIMAFANCRRR